MGKYTGILLSLTFSLSLLLSACGNDAKNPGTPGSSDEKQVKTDPVRHAETDLARQGCTFKGVTSNSGSLSEAYRVTDLECPTPTSRQQYHSIFKVMKDYLATITQIHGSKLPDSEHDGNLAEKVEAVQNKVKFWHGKWKEAWDKICNEKNS